MGRSEAISSHLKPSIIGATIYRARYRARSSASTTNDDRINFRPRSFRDISRAHERTIHPCKCRDTDWKIARKSSSRDLRPFNIAYAIHTPESPVSSIDTAGVANTSFSSAILHAPRLSRGINSGRNNDERDQKPSRSLGRINADTLTRA